MFGSTLPSCDPGREDNPYLPVMICDKKRPI